MNEEREVAKGKGAEARDEEGGAGDEWREEVANGTGAWEGAEAPDEEGGAGDEWREEVGKGTRAWEGAEEAWDEEWAVWNWGFWVEWGAGDEVGAWGDGKWRSIPEESCWASWSLSYFWIIAVTRRTRGRGMRIETPWFDVGPYLKPRWFCLWIWCRLTE